MSAGDVTAEEMEQAIENARTAVFRDPPWSPNARAFLAILTERDQLNAEVAALRRQLEERRVVVQEPPEEKELYDTLGDEECEASYEAVSHYLMGWRHCSESIRPLSSGEVVATPPADVVTVPRKEWEVLNTISAFWCPPFGVPQNTATEALFAKLDALRSGEAENKGGA